MKTVTKTGKSQFPVAFRSLVGFKIFKTKHQSIIVDIN